MISINDIISLQNEKEKVGFIQFLEGRNKRHDARNVSLYKDFLHGNDKRLLNEINANSYNALKKRLCDQLIEFSASNILSNELSSENKVIKLIALARRLLSAGSSNSGLTLLKRAEKVALGLEHHSILNEIYHTMIEYSHESGNADLEVLFKKLERNNEQFITQERLSVLYASMQKQFNTRNLSMMPSSLHEMYNEGLKTFGVDTEMALTFRNLNQLCILTDLYASQTKNYNELDLFFEDFIKPIQGGEKDNENALKHHIELLYGLANIYFRRNDLTKSKCYLEQMLFQMERFNGKYLSVWRTRYTNLLALNYNFSASWEKALELINESLTNQKLTEKERFLLSLNLCVIHFQQGNLLETKNILNAFKKTDAWYLKVMGNEWLFNYKAIEVLLHFDLGNDELADSLILSFKRKYAIHFKSKKDNPIWPFLLLVKSVLYDPTLIRSKKFEKRVESNLPWKDGNEDFFNLCFYAWLKAKMKNESIYATTMDLLKSDV
jgi:hypothetical protein